MAPHTSQTGIILNVDNLSPVPDLGPVLLLNLSIRIIPPEAGHRLFLLNTNARIRVLHRGAFVRQVRGNENLGRHVMKGHCRGQYHHLIVTTTDKVVGACPRHLARAGVGALVGVLQNVPERFIVCQLRHPLRISLFPPSTFPALQEGERAETASSQA
jgi:hypothetical protein